MDGLPALHIAQKSMVSQKIEPLKKMVGPLAPTYYRNSNRFGLEHLLLVAMFTAIITALAISSHSLDAARAIALRLPANASQYMHAPMRTVA